MYHFEDTRKVAHFGLIVPFFKPYIKSLHKFFFFLFYSLRYSRDFEKFYEFHRPIEFFTLFFSNHPIFFFHSSKLEKFFKIPTYSFFAYFIIFFFLHLLNNVLEFYILPNIDIIVLFLM